MNGGDALDALDRVRCAELLELLGVEAYSAVVRATTGKRSRFLDDLKAGLDLHDGARVASLAHAVKSSYGTLGLGRAYHLLEEVETMGRAGRLEAVSGRMDILEHWLRQDLADLGRWIGMAGAPPEAASG